MIRKLKELRQEMTRRMHQRLRDQHRWLAAVLRGHYAYSDRALQRTTAEVLSAIYEQDFLPCSFGGRPKLSAHHALATLNEVIAGGKIGWVLEADLKNFFGRANLPPFRTKLRTSRFR